MKNSGILLFCLFLGLQLVIVKFVRYKCPVIANTENINLIQKHNLPTLFDIGTKYKTDKIYKHHYEKHYEKYFTSYRHTSVRLLEIGLGCGMPLGAGASASTWREYLGPNADIHIIEFDKTCGQNWMDTTGKQINVTAYFGSQEDIQFLEQFKSKMSPFDIIIDDGGHTMNQQKTSFFQLIPLVRSGGIYVIEDLETSYVESYGGGYLKPSTTISFFKTLIDELQPSSPNKTIPIANKISSMEIGDSICFFTLK